MYGWNWSSEMCSFHQRLWRIHPISPTILHQIFCFYILSDNVIRFVSRRSPSPTKPKSPVCFRQSAVNFIYSTKATASYYVFLASPLHGNKVTWETTPLIWCHQVNIVNIALYACFIVGPNDVLKINRFRSSPHYLFLFEAFCLSSWQRHPPLKRQI